MTDVQKWKKIPEGTHKVIDGRDMIRQNGEWVPAKVNVRNSPKGKEYNIQGTEDWHSTNDGSDVGTQAQGMEANTVNRDAITGDLKPDKPKPTRAKGTNYGENYMSKPWKYDSPGAYFKAWAVAKPKTKIGKYIYGTINTVSWLGAWYKNKHPENAQTKAVDEGYESALKNIDSWLGDIDPTKQVDDITSKDINRAYKESGKKLEELKDAYNNAVGKNDPESIRIKTEYKTYQKLHNKLESDLSGDNRKMNIANMRERARQYNRGLNAGLRDRV